MDKNKKLEDAIMKKALGFEVKEEAEEFGLIDGELKLLKKKTSKKVFPPDLSALQFLMEKSVNNKPNKYSNMTLEELKKEKLKLITMLSKEVKKDEN